jgi:hypothetical protein
MEHPVRTVTAIGVVEKAFRDQVARCFQRSSFNPRFVSVRLVKTSGIFVLHAVEHHCAFLCRLIAKCHIWIFIGNRQKHVPDDVPRGIVEDLGISRDDFYFRKF